MGSLRVMRIVLPTLIRPTAILPKLLHPVVIKISDRESR